MKSLILSAIAVLSITTSLNALATGPVSQMGSYEPTNVRSSLVNQIWNQMDTEMDGDDCYRRAQIWTTELYDSHRIKSKKIFLHYTDKGSKELDGVGGQSLVHKKKFRARGLSRKMMKLVRNNITWDYHVAPMIVVEGKDLVLDRYLPLPYDVKPGTYTERDTSKKKVRPSTISEWVEGLTTRGEILWIARKAKLKEEIKKASKALRKASSREDIQKAKNKLASKRATWKALKMDQSSIDIKCEKIDSIAELDKNHKSAWCFWSEAPMYYYNERDLRTLAYGKTGYDYDKAPPASVHTEQNYLNGRNYVQTYFNPEETEDAQSERKFSF